MALENIALAVDGGIVSASLMRMLAYQATGGEEGVGGIGDMAVRQTAIASSQVRIAAGGAVLVNRYPGVQNESYMIRAGDETLLDIPANGGSTPRTDMVIAYVDDWNMPGGSPLPPGTVLPTNSVATAKYRVYTGIPAGLTKASQLNLSYPAIALAVLTVPPATAAITQAMITNVRRKAVPRRQDVTLTKALIAGQEDALDTAGPAVEIWPNAAVWPVEVPEWAARCRVRATWSGVNIPAGSTRSGGVYAYIGQGNAAGFATQKTGLKAPGSTQPGRATVTMSDDVAIPKGLRGVTSNMQLMGSLDGGAGGYPTIDSYSSVSLELTFIEASTEDV